MKTLSTNIHWIVLRRLAGAMLVCSGLHAAERLPDGGGSMPVVASDAADPSPRLQQQAIAPFPKAIDGKGLPPRFVFPLRQAVGESEPLFHGVSNFVDQDGAFPDQIRDYQCGQRTYDLQSGYNHAGVDFFTWPFPWRKMEGDDVAVVAAAPGVIAAKLDNQSDRSCGQNEQAQPNFVVLNHDDGSQSQYLHLKRDSATEKLLGERVDEGEYLGIVGSSGFSTGPHLHFEVHNPGGQIIEPYAGDCNDRNAESWWQEQLPYFDSSINALATHDAPPVFPDCPQSEETNLHDNFAAGDSVYVAAYYHDQRAGQRTDFEIVDPAGTATTTWDFAMSEPDHYAGSYWYWQLSLPTDAMPGTWLFRANFEGGTTEHAFFVDAAPEPVEPAPATNAQYAGLWYDPALEGEGVNVVPTAFGLIIYYYGSDRDGERLWLVSDLIAGAVSPGELLSADLFESSGGVFSTPVSSRRGLSRWGLVALRFTGCEQGTLELRGRDGVKQAQLIKLAGIVGSGCSGDIASSGSSGLWYATDLEGEGYNIVESGVGTLIYYYGFNRRGQRQWLVSDVISDPLSVGSAITTDLYSSIIGEFDAPIGSALSLERWGTLDLTRDECDAMTVDLRGRDGRKTTQIVRLAGVVGDACP